MRLGIVCLAFLLAGCASTPQEPLTHADPLDPQWPSPEPGAPWGRFDIRLSATPRDEHAPADVLVSLTVRPTNAVGEDIPADVSWRLDGPGGNRSGEGRSHEETFRLGRGTHTFTAVANATGFLEGRAEASLTIVPPPLQATVHAADNATKGEWTALDATATDGFSDLGASCTWRAETGVLENASSCSTRIRWSTLGNQTVMVQVHDGVAMASAAATVRVLPPEPVPRPTAVPADPLLSDAAGPSDEEPYPPHADVVAAWFAHNADVLHVALAVKDAATGGAAAQAMSYSVSFAPSWNVTTEDGPVELLRVTTSWSHGNNPPDGVWSSTLQGLQADTWVDLATLDPAPPEAGSILWWTLARDALQAPPEGGSLRQIGAEARAPADGVADEAASTAAYLMH